jgi:hypothetical protein
VYISNSGDSDYFNLEELLRPIFCNSKSNAISETDRGGPQGCEMSKIPHFLDSHLIDGGEVVS